MVLRDQGTKERINRGLKSAPMGSVLPRRNQQPIEEHDPSRTWRADTITLYVAGPNFGLPRLESVRHQGGGAFEDVGRPLPHGGGEL